MQALPLWRSYQTCMGAAVVLTGVPRQAKIYCCIREGAAAAHITPGRPWQRRERERTCTPALGDKNSAVSAGLVRAVNGKRPAWACLEKLPHLCLWTVLGSQRLAETAAPSSRPWETAIEQGVLPPPRGPGVVRLICVEFVSVSGELQGALPVLSIQSQRAFSFGHYSSPCKVGLYYYAHIAAGED